MKQEMIDKIYQVVADKSLTLWCKFIWYKEYNEDLEDYCIYWEYIYINQHYDWEYDAIYIEWTCYCIEQWINKKLGDEHITELPYEDLEIERIIGHPVLIWHMLERIQDNLPDNEDNNLIFNYWKKLKLPIESQSAECILFVYNLIKNMNYKRKTSRTIEDSSRNKKWFRGVEVWM